MSLIIKKIIDNETLLGIWEITEDFDTLFSLANLDNDDINTLQTFRNAKRKLEWLSIRVLLKKLITNSNKIIYSSTGKPFLLDKSYKIGISHSKNLSSIIISKQKDVSIDIEFMSEKIKNIKHRFLCTNELQKIDTDNEIFHLYLHWCAKETLFKICNKQNIDFANNLFIEPFTPKAKGIFYGKYYNNTITEEFTLNYFTIKNYSIVFCYK